RIPVRWRGPVRARARRWNWARRLRLRDGRRCRRAASIDGGVDVPDVGPRPSAPAESDARHGPGRMGAVRAPPAEDAVRVSTLELFFDLVFVFTITQLTSVLAHDTSVRGLVQ